MSKLRRPFMLGAGPRIDQKKTLWNEEITGRLLQRWGLEDQPEVAALIAGRLDALAGKSIEYLDAVSRLEQSTTLRIAEGGTPPRIYYEGIERLLRSPVLTEDEKAALENLNRVEKEKPQLVVDTMNDIKVILQDKGISTVSGYESSSKPLHVCMAGTMIKEVIGFVKDACKAEINFCKSPNAALAGNSPA